jgi:hypothetical protein
MRSQFLLLPIITAILAPVVIALDESSEASAIQKIKLLGGNVEREETLPDRPVIGIVFYPENRLNEKYLRLFTTFTSLNSFDLRGIELTDAGMKELMELKKLTKLYVSGVQSSKRDLKNGIPR